jgi:hypothetical protein
MVELADSDPSRSEVICRKSAELPEPNKPAALHLAARRASGTARLPGEEVSGCDVAGCFGTPRARFCIT